MLTRPQRALAMGPPNGRLSPLALGPGRRSEFFDPKMRLAAASAATWRGKSGHHRAGCCTSRKASAGAAGQAAATDSVTENRLPSVARESERWRVRVKRWGKSPPRSAARRAARKTPSGARQNKRLGGPSYNLGYVASAEAPRKRSEGGSAEARRKPGGGGREMTAELRPNRGEQNPAYRPQS